MKMFGACGVYTLCSALLTGKTCAENALTECGSELPTSVRQGLQAMVSTVNFLCVEEFERQWCKHCIKSYSISQAAPHCCKVRAKIKKKM